MQLEQLTAGHGSLTAVRTGTGRDLVVLHSLLADRRAFDPVLPALTASHRVTLINLPGFHGSQPCMLPLMDAYVAVIEDGFQEFGIASDSILIGNGFGGTVALAFALAHPERIAKLLLSDAAACFPDEGRKQFEVMATKVSEGGLGAIAEIAAKRVFSPAYLAAHPELIDERKRVLMRIDPKAFQAACKILQEADLEPLLHRMRVPTLVVCGEFDQATPPPLNKSIAEKVAGARYIELP
ncbi:MAG TPA: alpha/beta fold hydrolase, partial [Pseudolabrys sp.]|nr:alpha/beta fold hydrolase [Pseudolabrys sp.]